MGVYKRGKTWWIDYYFKGERIREPVGKKTEAQERLGGRLEEIRDGKFRGTKPIRPTPFEDLVDEYEKTAKEKKGYVVSKYYIKIIRAYFAGRPLRDITALDVERFKNERKETPTRGKKARSGAAVNRELATLRAMLSKAATWELIEKNPAAKVKDFPEPPGRNESLSIEEAGRLLKVCHPHLKPIVLCALETGMRKGEILGLKWRDIRNGLIYLTADRTKNGKAREIPVSDRLGAELRRLKEEQGKGKIVAASELVFRSRWTFRRAGSAVRDFRNAWAAAKKAAGILAGFRFHDLRHTVASWLKMSGADDYTVMEILGHSDFAMMKRYAHLTPEHKRKAIGTLREWKEEGRSQIGHKSGENEKGLRTESPQALVFAGAEGGS